MAARDSNPSFMNGVPELLILTLLRGQEMYGYEIVQAIHDRTQDAIAIGEGVVYPVLHALEEQGALRSRRKTVAGRSRIYYALTRTGARRLADLTANWSHITSAIQNLVANFVIGGNHAQAVS
ncbi:MAG: PadR family transcriptional regulator [Acidobacteriaceae bacterium]